MEFAPVFDHAETISPQSLDRVRELEGGIAVQDRMAYQGKYFRERYGAEADRMQEMIGTLLDFTQARFLGKVHVSPVPADMAEIAHGVVDELRVAWPDHGIELEVRGESHGRWDPGRMGQVISNLIGNAITYGDPDPPIRVCVDGGDDEMVVKVSNHGAPIPADVLPVLFEPFRRGVPGDRSPRGLGLGLYIVQQVVLAHDGTVDVASTAQEGTTFTVRLPRKRADSQPHETVSPVLH